MTDLSVWIARINATGLLTEEVTESNVDVVVMRLISDNRISLIPGTNVHKYGPRWFAGKFPNNAVEGETSTIAVIKCWLTITGNL